MCIPGSALDDCSDCIKTASDGLMQSFPNQTDTFSWTAKPTLCHVRYSNTSFSGFADLELLKNIYALMQCTPDLPSGDCDNCLRQSANNYQSCCSQKQGGVVLRPSCFFRWDLFPFTKAFGNITMAPPPHPVPQPPSSASDRAYMLDNNDCKGVSPGIVVVITVQTVFIIFILLVLGVVLLRRRNLSQRTELESDNHISTIH
ncbi:hypothetical protein AALP_AA7G059700 [Arabis alpina]|uniref:Gnk2-homologous domain-containing protein n=1 Tax=Arabis alpina TaxID=50452 RepID=A0A087GG76_ARAAL|nr:hypothetical protein AALP_AA7G059700 [Arabis alpina]